MKQIEATILGQSYMLACPPDGEALLRDGMIVVKRDGRPLLTASFAGDRRPLTDASLARLFVTHALLTFKVTAAIHWEALWMWLKGEPIRHRPPPPQAPVTVAPAAIPGIPASIDSRPARPT